MKHLFFTGEKGVGKSTLLHALLRRYSGTVGGFYTKKLDGAVYLLRPGEEPTEENRLFFCLDDNAAEVSARFSALGLAALQVPCAVMVMDELGPHESDAADFCHAVLAALEGDIPILGVLQRANTPFLQSVAQHPRVFLVEVTAENRDTLAETLIKSGLLP